MNSDRMLVLFNFFLLESVEETMHCTQTKNHENSYENQWNEVYINWVPFWYIFGSIDSGAALTMHECYGCLSNIWIDTHTHNQNGTLLLTHLDQHQQFHSNYPKFSELHRKSQRLTSKMQNALAVCTTTIISIA